MKKLAGFLGVLSLVALAPLARANYQISYQLNGGAITNCANSSNDDLATCFTSPTNIGGGVTITQLTGTSNSPGTTGEAIQTGSVVDITTTGSGTLNLWLAAQDFTMPVTPPGLNDKGSLTVIPTSGTGTVALTNCVDQSNGTAPPLGPFCSTPAVQFNNPMITYSDTTSQSNNVSAGISNLSAPFSLSELVTITFSSASEIEVQTRQVLATPEPASIMLMGSLLAGIATLIRKKAARRA